MMDNILILYSSKHHPNIKEFINKNKANYFGIVVDNNIYHTSDLPLIKFLNNKDYLEPYEITNIDKAAHDISLNWYLKGNKELSIEDNISIGRVVQYDIMNISCQILKSYYLLRKIIEKENIASIAISSVNDYFNASAIEIARTNNIGIYELHTINENYSTPRIKKHLKAFINKIDKWIYKVLNFKKGNCEIGIFYSERNLNLIYQLAKNTRVALYTTTPIVKLKLLFRKNIHICKLTQHTLQENDFILLNNLQATLSTYIKTKFNEDILNLFLTEHIQIKFQNLMRMYLSHTRSLFEKLESSTLKLTIVGQDFQGIPRLLSEISNNNNIKTLVLQHGIYGFFPYYTAPISKFVAIWGEQWMKWLASLDNSVKNFVVTGEPYYDELFKVKNKKRKDCNKINILIPFQPNVTISALSDYSENERKIIRILNTLAKFDNQISITLKMRNNEQIQHGQKIKALSKLNKEISIIGKANNFKLIQNTDVVITNNSTMGFEALLANKMVLIDNIEKASYLELNPFHSFDFTTIFNSEAQLENIIGNLVKNQHANNTERKYFNKLINTKYYTEGQSLSLTIKRITKILND